LFAKAAIIPKAATLVLPHGGLFFPRSMFSNEKPQNPFVKTQQNRTTVSGCAVFFAFCAAGIGFQAALRCFVAFKAA
jgi:hypothetical protein